MNEKILRSKENKYYLNIKNTLFCLIGFLLFFFYLLNIIKTYPYYFSWDMNLAVTVDNILLRSEKYSSLLAHPGFGMNLLLLLTTKILSIMGYLSIDSLTDLALSLDPISCVAELSQMIQLHSPFLITIILFSVWISLCVILKTNTTQSILIFLVLSLSESNIIHSSFIRVGTYAIFFFSLSILFSVLFSKSERMINKHLCLFLSGVFIGLSFLTKVQMLFLLVLPLFLVLFSDFLNGEKRSYQLSVNSLVNINFINIVLFITLSIFSFFILIPNDFSSWMSDEDYGQLTFVFLMFITFFSFLFINTLFLVNKHKIKSLLKLIFLFFLLYFIPLLSHRSIEPVFMGYFSKKMFTIICIYSFLVLCYFLIVLLFDKINKILFSKPFLKNKILVLLFFFKKRDRKYLSVTTVFMSGFIFSFLLHFLVFTDLNMSINYMLYDFKVIFFRSTFYEIDIDIILNQIIHKTIFYYKEILINSIITLFITLLYYKKYININYKTLLIILSVFFIAHFNLYFGTRAGVDYDSIFIDYPINIFSIIGLLTIYNKACFQKIKLKLFCLSIFSIIIFLNLNQFISTEELSKHHAHHYRWQDTRWKKGAYFGNQQTYTNLMQSKYNEYNANLACRIGLFQKSRLLDAKYVFPNQNIDQKHIGILHEGFSTMIDQPNFKISSYPKELKNTIVIDNLTLEILDKGLFAPDSLSYPRFKNLDNQRNLLAICPRLDLDVYFFTDDSLNGDNLFKNKNMVLHLKKYYKGSDNFLNEYANRKLSSKLQIVMEKNKSEKIFYGYRIINFTELDINSISGSGFFVIKQAMVPL